MTIFHSYVSLLEDKPRTANILKNNRNCHPQWENHLPVPCLRTLILVKGVRVIDFKTSLGPSDRFSIIFPMFFHPPKKQPGAEIDRN
jgi:hypothetical protein